MITAHFIGGERHGKDQTFSWDDPPPYIEFPVALHDRGAYGWFGGEPPLDQVFETVRYRRLGRVQGYVLYACENRR